MAVKEKIHKLEVIVNRQRLNARLVTATVTQVVRPSSNGRVPAPRKRANGPGGRPQPERPPIPIGPQLHRRSELADQPKGVEQRCKDKQDDEGRYRLIDTRASDLPSPPCRPSNQGTSSPKPITSGMINVVRGA